MQTHIAQYNQALNERTNQAFESLRWLYRHTTDSTVHRQLMAIAGVLEEVAGAYEECSTIEEEESQQAYRDRILSY